MTDRNRHSTANQDGSRSEEKLGVRRIGSVLTLAVVCVATVFIGFFVGRYVIQGVVQDAFGIIPLNEHNEKPTVSMEVEQRSTSFRSNGQSDSEHNERGASQAVTATGSALSAETTRESPGANTERANSSTVSNNVDEERVQTGGTRSEVTSSRESTTPSATETPPASDTHTTRRNEEHERSTSTEREEVAGRNVLYRIQVGSFNNRDEAANMLERLQNDYPDAFVVVDDEFRVQIGAFSLKQSADEVADALEKQGFTPVHKIRVEL